MCELQPIRHKLFVAFCYRLLIPPIAKGSPAGSRSRYLHPAEPPLASRLRSITLTASSSAVRQPVLDVRLCTG